MNMLIFKGYIKKNEKSLWAIITFWKRILEVVWAFNMLFE